VTAAVHFVHFHLMSEAVEALAGGPASLVIDHPEYRHYAPLDPRTVASLRADLAG
jgi:hypothetical protein